MKEAFELIKERLLDRSNDAEAQMYYLQDKSYLLPCMFNQIDIEEAISKAFCDARDIVSEVEAEFGKDINVRSNGWIPVEKAIPEDGQPIIATFTDGSVYQANFKLFLHENPEYAHNHNVIAWMPLPSPYKHTTD